MNKKDKIYIAGHTGLVGTSILQQLTKAGYSNLVYCNHKELDLRDQAAVEYFFKQNKPDYVFLCAAKVGGILANNTYKAEFIYDNLMIAANVIHGAKKYNVKKLLNLGSSCIYPKNAPQPMKEEYLLSGYLEPTNEPYAIAKITAIKLCRYYNEQYGTDFISVMPTNLYGPNDNFNLETSHVLAGLIRKFHLAKLFANNEYELIKNDFIKVYPGFNFNSDYILTEESIERFLNLCGIYKDKVLLWGTGEPYREFMYVDDLARCCIFLMENYSYKDIGEIINIGVGKDIKIKELANLTKELIGFKGEVQFDSKYPSGTPRKLLDISKLKQLGFSPTINLEAGIKLTYEYYLKISGIN